MHRPSLVALLALVLPLAACGSSGTSAQIEERDGGTHVTWTFDGGASSGLPADLEDASGRWSLARDEHAPSGATVLRQLDPGDAAAFNVLLTSASAQDLDLSVALRADAGAIDQGGGLVWRARDGSNYYVVRWNPLEDNFRLYTVVGGRRTQVAHADVTVDPKAWHTVRVAMRGERIECWLDGRLLLEKSDPTFTAAGRVGLWTKADARTSFDDLRLGPAR